MAMASDTQGQVQTSVAANGDDDDDNDDHDSVALSDIVPMDSDDDVQDLDCFDDAKPDGETQGKRDAAAEFASLRPVAKTATTSVKGNERSTPYLSPAEHDLPAARTSEPVEYTAPQTPTPRARAHRQTGSQLVASAVNWTPPTRPAKPPQATGTVVKSATDRVSVHAPRVSLSPRPSSLPRVVPSSSTSHLALGEIENFADIQVMIERLRAQASNNLGTGPALEGRPGDEVATPSHTRSFQRDDSSGGVNHGWLTLAQGSASLEQIVRATCEQARRLLASDAPAATDVPTAEWWNECVRQVEATAGDTTQRAQREMHAASRLMSSVVREVKGVAALDSQSLPLGLRGLPPIAEQISHLLREDVRALERCVDRILGKVHDTSQTCARSLKSASFEIETKCKSLLGDVGAIRAHSSSVMAKLQTEEMRAVHNVLPAASKAREAVTKTCGMLCRHLDDTSAVCEEDVRAMTDALRSKAASLDACKDPDLVKAMSELIKLMRNAFESCSAVVANASSSPRPSVVSESAPLSAKEDDVELSAETLRLAHSRLREVEDELKKGSSTDANNDAPMTRRARGDAGADTELDDDELIEQEEEASRMVRRTRLLREAAKLRRTIRVLEDHHTHAVCRNFNNRRGEWLKRLGVAGGTIDTIATFDAERRASTYAARDAVVRHVDQVCASVRVECAGVVSCAITAATEKVCLGLRELAEGTLRTMADSDTAVTQTVQALTSVITSLEGFLADLHQSVSALAPEASSARLREAISTYCRARTDASAAVERTVKAAHATAIARAYAGLVRFAGRLTACRRQVEVACESLAQNVCGNRSAANGEFAAAQQEHPRGDSEVLR